MKPSVPSGMARSGGSRHASRPVVLHIDAAAAHAAGISTYTYQKFEKGESRPGTPMNPRH